MKYQTKVITDEAQVPPGYVRISELTADKNVATAVSKLHVEGHIPAVKLMTTARHFTGPVWVDREMAIRCLGSVAGRSKPAKSPDLFDSLPQNDGMERVERLLERIANSLDLIADAATRVATTSEAGGEQWDSPQS